MALKFYEYKGCDTCRKARKFLEAKGVKFAAIPIREQPPTPAELRRMLKIYEGNLQRLFNTSGDDYRRLNLKTKLPQMSEAEAIALLADNGNLVKRPFVLGDAWVAVGFKPEEWGGLC